MENTLKITGVGFPPYTNTHSEQSLEMIPHGEFVRALDGRLTFVGEPGAQKYRSTIKGRDPQAPTLASLTCGQLVAVHCIQRLFQEMKGRHTTLRRPWVPKSLYATDEQGQSVDVRLEEGQIILEEDVESPVFFSYCPILEMMVQSFKLENVGAEIHWSLTLEEI